MLVSTRSEQRFGHCVWQVVDTQPHTLSPETKPCDAGQRLVIELPVNLDARLDIESGYTGDHGKPVFGAVPKIESDFPVHLSEREGRNGNGTPRWYVTASGTIGSGRGLIKIRTNHGDVVIRRR